ncbi:IS110 family transposase [candidate division KSB1 bacterium]
MKKKSIIVGIDVSKATLDVHIQSTEFHFVVENAPNGFVNLLETTCKMCNCKKQDLFFCFENTGKYSRMLSVFLHSQSIKFAMVPASEIKKSLGMTRGKDDKICSRRIANYAFEKNKKLTPTVLSGKEIDQLKMLLSLREKLIKHRTAYKNGIQDLYDCFEEGETLIIKESQKRLICRLNEEIETLENEIIAIIKSNQNMDRNYYLIQTITGIGKITALYLIAYTGNFTMFPNARAFACYTGIAPFANSSGTIVGKPRVHHYANKRIKSILNMAAMSSIQLKGEFKVYYEKRINEFGKNKMSTLNIIRNKLLYRVFAVVNRGTPYVNLYKFA